MSIESSCPSIQFLEGSYSFLTSLSFDYGRDFFFCPILFPISCASLSLSGKQKKGQKSLLWSWLFFHAFCFRYKMDLFNSLFHLHFSRILLFLPTPNQSHICSSFIISTSIAIDVRWWLDGSKFNHHRPSIESLSRNMEMSCCCCCCCCCWLGFNSRMSCGRKAYHSHPSQRWNSGRKMAHRGEKTREKKTGYGDGIAMAIKVFDMESVSSIWGSFWPARRPFADEKWFGAQTGQRPPPPSTRSYRHRQL